MSTRLARPLHPLAWWAWALGLAAAASRTTDPVLLLLVLAVAGLVVTTRRGDAPWSRAFAAALVLGGVVVAVRVLFAVLLGQDVGGTVLLRLPEVPLPAWAAGIDLGGDVEAEVVAGAAVAGLRLAVLIACVGAANALVDPRRALRLLPAALYEAGVAVVVALTLAPQLLESGLRVRRARRLRGEQRRGAAAVRSLAMPVLQDALERSLALAAAMDSRGYGRTAGLPARTRRATGALLLAGLGGLLLGAYGLLDPTAAPALGLPVLAVGAVAAVAGLRLGGRRVVRTAYRPDPWRAPETAVAASGVAVAVLLVVAGAAGPGALQPATPLAWPDPPLLAVLAVLLGAAPAVLAPPPVRRSAAVARPARERVPA